MSLHVVLVEPQIPWNTGSVGRTCLAAGAQLHLVEPLGFRLDERAVRRAGLDYWPRVQPRVWPDWEAIEAELPRLGTPFLFSASAERVFWEVDFPEEAVLVFGREADGLSERLCRRYEDRLLRIPLRDGAIRSLNLATSMALATYEYLRQRRSRTGERVAARPGRGRS